MKAYRIGRQSGPWTNMTPPIRGGIYHKDKEVLISNELISEASEASEDNDSSSNADDISSTSSCDLTSDQTSLTSVSSSDEDALLGLSFSGKLSSPQAILRRRLQRECSEGIASDASDVSCPDTAANQIPLTPAQYTELAMQNDVKLGIRDYPSVDPAVQQDIIDKYRVLQQRIKDDGLYECPYLDYGKEMIRYSILFTVSMVSLHYEWYMTSAVFLGLFWVCSPSLLYASLQSLIANSNKSCSAHMMPDIRLLHTIS